MKRRNFVQKSLLAGSLASILPQISLAAVDTPQQKKVNQEFYELRVYTFKNETQQKIVEDYFQQAAIPALNRLGSKNIGIFTEHEPKEQTKLYAIIPYNSVEDFLKVTDKLATDSTYLKAGASYLQAPATAPAYERIESSFMKAFTGLPKIQVPEKKPRIFELRRYESHSEMAGKKKIEMFNEAGEITIFKRVGLTPVFFGETIIGTLRPNLTYMLTFDDMEERNKNWKVFGSDPEWKKISGMAEYANAKIVSRITNTFLVPAAFSQI
jgi:hypothetical protein